METHLELVVEPRANRSPRSLRQSGIVPGILYGPDLPSPKPVQVRLNVLETALRQGAEHHPIVVRIGKQGKQQPALLKEVQRDLFSQRPIHFDVLAVSEDKPVRTEVPIVVHGSDELRRKGLLMQLQMESLPVEAPLKLLPDHIDVEIAHLEEGDFLTVADLKVPAGVSVEAEANSVVLSITRPHADEAEEAAAAPAAPAAAAAPAAKAAS
jgi:large subunit ribosomal protein L25